MWDERRQRAAEERDARAEGDAENGVTQTSAPAGAAKATPGEVPANIPPGPHALDSAWAIWEHRAAHESRTTYEQNMAKIIEFSTIEDFWRAWNNLPKPSDIFFDGKSNKKVGDRVIESLSLFKAGIKPEWEDKANRQGGEWFVRKTLSLGFLDEAWKKLVLGMIGETLDPEHEVTGARVVDKSVRGKAIYRLELWFRSKAKMDVLRDNLMNNVNDPKRPFTWEFRSHS